MAAPARPPAAVLEAWGFGEAASVLPVTTGLINLTYRVEEGARHVALQRLHPIFDARVNQDIDAITAHLEAEGMRTPRPVRTTTGELSLEAEDGSWRALGWIDGVVHERVTSTSLASEGGRLAGRFHAHLAPLEHDFHFQRPDAHDFARHLAGLSEALAKHRVHGAHAEVKALATQIVAHALQLPRVPALPVRIIHGDLKITNLLFDDVGAGVAVVDLDTLAHGRMDVELGDAMRSWCNPGGEDQVDAEFDPELFAAALAGFHEGSLGLLSQAEREAVVSATERIALELSSRFARDTLEEARFGWNEARFESRSAHNLHRARGQLSLARSIRDQREVLERLARHALND